MKLFLTVFLLCFLTSCITPQSASLSNKENWVYLDQDKNQITAEDFQQKWRNKENNFVRYDYVAKDTGRVATLFEPIYSQYLVKYSTISKKLEELTGKQFSQNTIFLIEYRYVDDPCGKYTNNWTKGTIKKRKRFTSPNKNEIEKLNSNLVVLNFFEEGISLKNNPELAEEYFFIDTNSFLRKNLFKDPSFCGSYALIKPDGETLVRNGEYSAQLMAGHLQSDIWNKIFTD